ncbi:MAG: hypothetical protein CBD58_02005 [bacterium TMED198]|nr:MAG: hypothetical protein CBD58_02005 [bacterium TMED198]
MLINKEIIEAFKTIADEKNIDRVELSTIIEDIFIVMIEKKYGEDIDNFSVIANMEKGEIEIYQEKTVVEEVDDEIKEISLKKAIKVEPDLELGDPFVEIVDPESFGRRLISSAKQFLSQKLKEIERNAIYGEFNDKIGQIFVGSVHQIQRDRIFIIKDNVEIMLPKSEQMPNDRYRRGETIRGILKDIKVTARGPEIILSRSDDSFLEKLFELEIPEIEDGIIEIKSVSRVAGDRSKIVVYSSDRRIDAVGACVGMRGSRIQSIVRELNGEKIDIINWSERPEILISRALAPARPIDLYLDEERPFVVAVFEDEELSMAIGKNGQNIRLASNVTNYRIDAVKRSEHQGENNIYLEEIEELNEKHVNILSDNNIVTSADFEDLDKDHILSIKGLGPKTYEKIISLIQVYKEKATEDVKENVNEDTVTQEEEA